MKITIVTAALNAEEFIADTMHSVLSQKGNFNLEYILVLGNSSDNTDQIVAKVVGEYENTHITVTTLHRENYGLYDAIVFGFNHSSGEVMGYLNADDVYYPGTIQKIVETFANNDAIRWLTGKPNTINSSGRSFYIQMPIIYSRRLIRKGYYGTKLPFIQQECTFWSRSAWMSVNSQALKSYKLAGDFFIWHSFATEKIILFQINSILAGFRSHGNQLSKLNSDQYLAEFTTIKHNSNILEHFILSPLIWALTYLLNDNLKPYINYRRFIQ
jgi:glycosyltransferase involved in cell wall biosynthesis